MRDHVHARGVEVTEPRHVLLGLALHEVEGGGQELLVHRLHPLPGQRAGVLDRLLANLPEHRIDGRIVLVRRLALEDAAGAEFGLELRVLGVVDILGLFLGVEVIQIPEELIEAMHRRQVFVAIAKMVLAELAGRVTEALEHLRDGHVFGLDPQGGARHANLGQARADRLLARDKSRTASGAALLAIEVREHRALAGDAIHVRRPITHDAVVVTAQIEPSNVVGHDEENVRLARL